MRLFRRSFANPKTRRRTSRSAALRADGSGLLKRPASKPPRAAVDTLVKQFQTLTLDQKHRAVRSVLQRNRRLSEDIDHFFRQADKDQDGLINNQEFRSFLSSRFSVRPVAASANTTNQSTERPTNTQLKLVMVASAIPFVGFGFVDNIIMLAAGDMIEDHFHATYHLSMLCAAALGNTVSDVVGLSLGGIIETCARRVGIPDPNLSKAQANMAVTHWCNFFASAGGITLGCLLGMFPLLFMNQNDATADGDTKADSATQTMSEADAKPRSQLIQPSVA